MYVHHILGANADTGRIDVEGTREASMLTAPIVAKAREVLLLGPFGGWRLIDLCPSQRELRHQQR